MPTLKAANAASPWTPRDLRLRKWVLDNPGSCKLIATACKVSAEYVRLVLYGKRGKNGKGEKVVKITRMLKQKGAPV